jgi:hypothetical protein
MSERISYIIDNICKELGIDYKSINTDYSIFIQDAMTLGGIYLQLKEILSTLSMIEERYKIEGLSKLFRNDLLELEKIDHHLLKIAHKIRKENEDKK